MYPVLRQLPRPAPLHLRRPAVLRLQRQVHRPAVTPTVAVIAVLHRHARPHLLSRARLLQLHARQHLRPRARQHRRQQLVRIVRPQRLRILQLRQRVIREVVPAHVARIPAVRTPVVPVLRAARTRVVPVLRAARTPVQAVVAASQAAVTVRVLLSQLLPHRAALVALRRDDKNVVG